MKKIITVLLVVVLMAVLCAVPSSAATAKNEWKKQTGPGKIELNEQGIKCNFDEGLTFFKYTKQTIDVKNFTCTFIPHFTEKSYAYFAITLTASKGYTGSGSNGLFLLLRVMQEGVVRVEGQILHMDYKLTDPKDTEINVDTTKPLVVKGVDNGNGTYTVSFEGGTGNYTFDIPENYQFTEDLNGQGYFTFGGTMDEGDAQRAMTVVSVNGIDFSGNKPEPSSTGSSNPTSSNVGTTDTTDTDSSTDTTDSSITDADDDTTTSTTTGNDDTATESNSNSTLIIVIIVCGVLVLAAATVFVIIVIKNKKSTELNEENSEETAE